MPCLKNCCCCISLRVGGIILGVFTLLGTLAFGIYRLVALLRTYDEKNQLQYKALMLLTKGITPDQAEEHLMVERVFLAIGIGADIIFGLSAILLICGAANSRKSFVVPFLICGTIYWIFWVLEFGYDVYRINHPKTPMTDEDELKAVAEAIGDFIAIVFMVYMWFCIFSLYQYLRDGMHRSQQVMYPSQSPYNPTVTYSVVAKE